jgi:hypothetical protein
MKKISIMIFLLIFSFFIFADERNVIETYSNSSMEELLKEENNLLKLNESYEKNYKLGLVYFFNAKSGKEKALKAADSFIKALTIQKNDIIQAYLGSTYTIAGSQAENVVDKVKYVNMGTKILDDVYKTLKDDYYFNTMYVQTNLALPDLVFHRLKYAEMGLKNLEIIFVSLNNDKKSEVLYYKAIYLQKAGKEKDAINLWEKITLDYKDTRYSKLSQTMLDKYGE